jgi:hypothetical protein
MLKVSARLITKNIEKSMAYALKGVPCLNAINLTMDGIYAGSITKQNINEDIVTLLRPHQNIS